MRVLLIDAYRPDDPDRAVVDAAAKALRTNGHEIDRVDLVADGFRAFMSEEERDAYHTDEPLIADDAKASAQLVRRADAMLFCYPTVTHTVPAVLKGWLERVLVLGVAFDFDDKGRIAPAMTRVRRIGAVTTTPHGWITTRRHGDLGRRTIMWTLRLNCNRLCRRTFVGVPTGAGGGSGPRIERALRRW
ncbi:MAG: NAD(P)H-dependent oxidoreductase [Actinomycetota bacterium]